MRFIDEALHQTFQQYRIELQLIAIEGFSDGASYALGLGLTNGDLFTHVVAFSPGFVPPVSPHGRPRVFVSHGEDDDVLPIGRTSRRLVPELRKRSYDVRSIEFEGGHHVPPHIADEAATWFLASRESPNQ